MKNNKTFRLGRCIAAFVVGYILTLVVLCWSFLSIVKKPDNVPDGAVHVGKYETAWIYEVGRNDSIIHLRIYYPNDDGNLALDADFENKGIDNIKEISNFDYGDRALYLDTRVCRMVKSYGGALHKRAVPSDACPEGGEAGGKGGN